MGAAGPSLSPSLEIERDAVAHALHFGAQVLGVDRIGCRLEGDTFNHGDPVGPKLRDLGGVVGDETDRRHLFQMQNRRRVVGARVARQAQRGVRLAGVQPPVLEAIGPDLVHEPDAATLLSKVEQRPSPLRRDQLQHAVELLVAGTAERAERLARRTFRVQPVERWRRFRQAAADDGRVFGPASLRGQLGGL